MLNKKKKKNTLTSVICGGDGISLSGRGLREKASSDALCAWARAHTKYILMSVSHSEDRVRTAY